MDFDTGRGRGVVRQVAGEVLDDVAGGRVEQFRVDARDFLSARELGEAISTRIEGRTAALADAAEIVNRSFPERDESGRFTNVISPVVMPNRRFTLWPFLLMAVALGGLASRPYRLVGICTLA